MNFNNTKRFETHAHSMYSNIRLIDSINWPKQLITKSNELGLSGICLTDHECLSGAVEWLNYEKELKNNGVIPKDFKCGIGNEIYLIDSRASGKKYFHYILIAKDTIGFRQLCELSSKSWYNSYVDRGLERVPTLKSELTKVVNKNPGHLIATTACLGGELPYLLFNYLNIKEKIGIDGIETQIAKDNIDNFISFNLELFGDDFYIEVAPGLSKEQIRFNTGIKEALKEFNLKYIYGTDAHYLTKELRPVHKAYLNSKEGDREVDNFYEYSHLMDNNEAHEYLSHCFTDKDFIDFCDNSMEIYAKIGSYDIFHNPIIPKVEVYGYGKDLSLKYEKLKIDLNVDTPTLSSLFVSDLVQERYWANQCLEGLKIHKLLNKKYLERLEKEADIIKTVGNKLGNCLFEYFNTFQHFIELFWNCGSLNGPGRGSSVCFLSNYLMGITQLNPVEWNLAEWRFLNKDRLELPDIDTDLSPSKRPLIFKKIREERGELRLLQVCTFGTEGTRSAILTAARGYSTPDYPDGIDVDEAQYIASLVPSERGFSWTLKECFEGDEEKGRQPIQTFINEVNKYEGLKEVMLGIEGLVNKRSQHASGVILYNEDPWNTGAVMRSPNGDLITQFSLHDTEKLGEFIAH